MNALTGVRTHLRRRTSTSIVRHVARVLVPSGPHAGWREHADKRFVPRGGESRGGLRRLGVHSGLALLTRTVMPENEQKGEQSRGLSTRQRGQQAAIYRRVTSLWRSR